MSAEALPTIPTPEECRNLSALAELTYGALQHVRRLRPALRVAQSPYSNGVELVPRDQRLPVLGMEPTYPGWAITTYGDPRLHAKGFSREVEICYVNGVLLPRIERFTRLYSIGGQGGVVREQVAPNAGLMGFHMDMDRHNALSTLLGAYYLQASNTTRPWQRLFSGRSVA